MLVAGVDARGSLRVSAVLRRTALPIMALPRKSHVIYSECYGYCKIALRSAPAMAVWSFALNGKALAQLEGYFAMKGRLLQRHDWRLRQVKVSRQMEDCALRVLRSRRFGWASDEYFI